MVEDERGIREGLVDILEDENYIVDAVGDGELGLYRALNWDYDCVLLDIMLPKMHGYDVLRSLRKKKQTPVIILTARDALEDRVFGLDQGADDFVVKPFEIDELLARVRSVRRRSSSSSQKAPSIQIGQISIDTNRKIVELDGEIVELTAKEYAFIEIVVHQKGKVVSKDYLLERLCSDEGETESNLLDVYVYKIRKKLGKDFIKTKRGQGYLIE